MNTSSVVPEAGSDAQRFRVMWESHRQSLLGQLEDLRDEKEMIERAIAALEPLVEVRERRKE